MSSLRASAKQEAISSTSLRTRKGEATEAQRSSALANPVFGVNQFIFIILDCFVITFHAMTGLFLDCFVASLLAMAGCCFVPHRNGGSRFFDLQKINVYLS
jgi:hypothetical protein